jgi:hypothetical protein
VGAAHGSSSPSWVSAYISIKFDSMASDGKPSCALLLIYSSELLLSVILRAQLCAGLQTFYEQY